MGVDLAIGVLVVDEKKKTAAVAGCRCGEIEVVN
jgi:hypothetical protein